MRAGHRHVTAGPVVGTIRRFRSARPRSHSYRAGMRISKSILRASLLAPFLVLGCLRAPPPTEPLDGHALQVLFLGNSLTYANDLPGMFRDLAIAGGVDVGVMMHAEPNRALIDFTFMSSVMDLVGSGVWDYVVLQQGTTSVPVCRDTLVLAAKIMDPLIRRGGGVPAIIMSWPSSNQQSLFPAVHRSFALAAQTVNGVFLPVGDAWLEAWKVNSDHALYSADGYHPGIAGSYLAALVIYEKLTGKDARELPADLRIGMYKISLPPATVRQLQEAAHAANALPVPLVVVPPTPVAPPITC